MRHHLQHTVAPRDALGGGRGNIMPFPHRDMPIDFNMRIDDDHVAHFARGSLIMLITYP
jgi:hypothetical protein